MSTSYGQLIKRDVINIVRNPMLVRARVMQTIILGIFIGGLYFKFEKSDYTNSLSWRTLTGFSFFMCINMMMMALAPIGLVFPL